MLLEIVGELERRIAPPNCVAKLLKKVLLLIVSPPELRIAPPSAAELLENVLFAIVVLELKIAPPPALVELLVKVLLLIFNNKEPSEIAPPPVIAELPEKLLLVILEVTPFPEKPIIIAPPVRPVSCAELAEKSLFLILKKPPLKIAPPLPDELLVKVLVFMSKPVKGADEEIAPPADMAVLPEN